MPACQDMKFDMGGNIRDMKGYFTYEMSCDMFYAM